MTGVALAHLAGNQVPARDTEAETSVAAAAAQAKAATEARYLMALHRPRNIDQVRVDLLASCRRPAFAATARYKKPVGGGSVVGPSIRFAEEAGRRLGNILVETLTLYDDDEKRIVRVSVADLESNLSYSADSTLTKTVERSKVRQGQEVLGERTNSQGAKTYIVRATEDELLTKQQAAISKHIRNGILRMLPSDILEEAMEQVIATLRDEDAKDPAAARKKLVDAFFAQGVGPDQLVRFLGHPLDQVSVAELNELRTVYEALRDGEARWVEVLEAKLGDQGDGNGRGRGTSALKEKLTKRAEAKQDEPAAESFAEKPAALEPTEEDLALDRQLAGEG